jgi:hypothetical protein
MITTVVNLKIESYDAYIGRGSPFGNPFKIGKDGDREEVIRKFKHYFVERLKDQVFKKKLLELRGKRLGCYCAPLACHGDVIAGFLNKLDD